MWWEKSTLPSSTRVKQWGAQQADCGALQGDRLSKTVPHTASWINKKLTSYVGPTHKAPWEQQPCANRDKLAFRSKGHLRGQKKGEGAPGRPCCDTTSLHFHFLPFCMSCAPFQQYSQAWDCFSTEQLCIESAPSPRPRMKKNKIQLFNARTQQ